MDWLKNLNKLQTMAVSKKQLKELECKFAIGDTFTNGDGHFTVTAITQRDEMKRLLKEPLYTLDRFPDAVYKDGKKVLELKPFDAYESEIIRQCSFNWRKVD